MPESPVKKSIPKGIRLLIRMWGTLSAVCIAVTGFIVMITITPNCLAIGIYQIFAGLMILPLEAPILCTNFPTLVKMSDWVEDHFKFWMRAALYLGFSLPPFFVCPETSTFIGGASVLVTAALYGVVAIGRKGTEAPAKGQDDVEMKTQLMNKDGEPNQETGL